MIHRNRRPQDYHEGKWNGLGGKCEADESALEAAIREFQEETDITLSPHELSQLGVIHFPNFKQHKNEDWLVFVFAAKVPEGVRPTEITEEGELAWVPLEHVSSLKLWDGDRYFIQHVLTKTPFHGTIWYNGQDAIRADVRALSLKSPSVAHL